MEIVKINSTKRKEFIDITRKIHDIIKNLSIESGLAVIYVPHTTAGITINEGADPSVQRDIKETLTRLIPEDAPYHHLEGNSDAHIQASVLGSSVIIPIHDYEPVLGTWQHIFFYDGDGPRHRTIYIQLLSN